MYVKNEKRLNLILTIAQAIASFALVVVTIIYVIHTQNMVGVMKEQSELSYIQFKQAYRPYLIVEYFDVKIKDSITYFSDSLDNNLTNLKPQDILYVYGIVKNIGTIPARFEIEKFALVIDGREYDLQTDNMGYKIYNNSIIVIFPDVGDVKSGLGIRTLLLTEEVKNLMLSKGEFSIVFRINYWGVGDTNASQKFFYEKHTIVTYDHEYSFNREVEYIDGN